MAKHNNKHRAKKKAEKERKRKLVAKRKLENIRKSEQESNAKAEEMRETLNELRADIKEQVANIDSAKQICIVLEKFTNNVITRRLDLSYLTEEVRERFKDIHEHITKTLDHIKEIRNKFIETAIKIQDPGVLRANVDSIHKYSEVLNGAQELMSMQSSIIDFGAECGQIIRDINKIIKDSEDLRKQNGDFSIMPIATPEELKFLGLDFNYETYEFENKDGGEIEIPYTNGHDEENTKEQIEDVEIDTIENVDTNADTEKIESEEESEGDKE